MDKFKNKYRIPSARLQSWDYGSNGAYFITICTKNREHLFGDIVDGKMQLNELGKLGEKYWMEIPNHFPFIELGNFVIMPNHTHGILIIDKTNVPVISVSVISTLVVVETLQCNVSTTTATTATNETTATNATTATNETTATTETNATNETNETNATNATNETTATNETNETATNKNEKMAKISPKSGTISTIIRSYKSVVSKNARLIHADFAWQSRFHDHIIRDAQSFETIQNYITTNPINWGKDKFYSNNI